MRSNYQVIREYIIEQIEAWNRIEEKRKLDGEKLSQYGEGIRDTLGNILSLMNMLQPPADGLKDALDALDMLYQEGETE